MVHTNVKNVGGMLFIVAFMLCALTVVVPRAHAETASTTPTKDVATLMETLKSLLAKVEQLKAELAKVKGEVNETLKDGLKEGMTDADIKKIQELLASDKEIYPEGKVTGYFGPMTKEAIKRFQAKHGLEVTGEINAETKELMLEYRKENAHKRPEGFFRAPGILKKTQDRICEQVQKTGWGSFCKDHKPMVKPMPGKNDDDDDEDEDEDEDEDDEVDTQEDKAKDAIEDAQEEIDSVEKDINEADSDVDTDEAESLLEEAKDLLKEAEDELDDEMFADAEEKADMAEDKAKEADDALEEAEEDAN